MIGLGTMDWSLRRVALDWRWGRIFLRWGWRDAQHPGRWWMEKSGFVEGVLAHDSFTGTCCPESTGTMIVTFFWVKVGLISVCLWTMIVFWAIPSGVRVMWAVALFFGDAILLPREDQILCASCSMGWASKQYYFLSLACSPSSGIRVRVLSVMW